MTNEETIKSLKKLKSFHNGSYGTAIDEAIKAIEQTRWIPCSERLPEEDGMYLISTCMNCIDTCLFYKDDDGYLWVDYEESVIAWMPLPAPYQPPTMMCEED